MLFFFPQKVFFYFKHWGALHSYVLSVSEFHLARIYCRSALKFFSVALGHFSDQNQNSQNYLFNLHIIVSLVHIKKAVSYFFEQVANALVLSCK
jgi:hypothetical protein